MTVPVASRNSPSLPVHLGRHVQRSGSGRRRRGRRGAARSRAPAGRDGARRTPSPGRARPVRRRCTGAPPAELATRRRRDQPCAASQAASSATLCATCSGAWPSNACRLVRAVAHRRAQAQPALAASCRSWVVSPIISVRSAATPSSSHQFEQHARMRLRERLVGGAGGVEQAAQLHRVERLVEAAARLAGGHRQPVAARASGRPAGRARRRTAPARPGGRGSGGDSARRAPDSRRAASVGRRMRQRLRAGRGR